MKKNHRFLRSFKWAATATFLLCILTAKKCAEIPDTPTLPTCKIEKRVPVQFTKINLQADFTQLSQFDRAFFNMYHNGLATSGALTSLSDLINTQEYNWLPDDRHSYIKVVVSSSKCSGAITDYYNKPEEVGPLVIPRVSFLNYPPEAIKYEIKTVISDNGYRVVWTLSKSFATLTELTNEGDLSEDQSRILIPVSLNFGRLIKRVVNEDGTIAEEFPSWGGGLNIGGNFNTNYEIDMH